MPLPTPFMEVLFRLMGKKYEALYNEKFVLRPIIRKKIEEFLKKGFTIEETVNKIEEIYLTPYESLKYRTQLYEKIFEERQKKRKERNENTV